MYEIVFRAEIMKQLMFVIQCLSKINHGYNVYNEVEKSVLHFSQQYKDQNFNDYTLQLSIRLAKLNEEIAEKEDDYLALKHYISAEENTDHLSGPELNKNEKVERGDEDNTGDHIPENYIQL